MITAAQLRAARGLLDWTRADLAKAANISPETVKNIEHGTFRPQENTAEAIKKAFQVRDVEFIENEGVRKKKELVRTFMGKEGFIELLDHVYSVAKNEFTVTRHFNFADNYLSRLAPEYLSIHADRMGKIQGLDAKCLVPEGDTNFPVDYCEYRWLKKTHSDAMPYYMYGNFVTLFMEMSSESGVTVVSINSESLAANLRKQFDIYWNESSAANAGRK